jgi:hypothetical protein
VILYLIETLGPVTITSQTGDITLNNDIGGHIVNSVSGVPDFNPDDKGVASLTISAPADTATITMQGARAEGDVVITTGGDLTAAKEITSVSGDVTIVTGGTATLSAVPIGSQEQVEYPSLVLPAIPPGPRAALPTPPGFASAGAPGVPSFAEIPVASPGQAVELVTAPGGAGGSVAFAGAGGRAGAPAGTTGTVGRPAAPTGDGVAQVSGSSDPAALDTASALRAAGLACKDESGEDDETGLAAATSTPATEESNPNKAACPPAAPTAQAAAGTPTNPAGSGGTSVTTIGDPIQ